MKPYSLLAGLLAGALLSGAPAVHAGASPHDHHADETAALARSADPFAPVYIVASHETWRGGLQAIARDGVERRDSVGTALMLARIQANQLAEVSHLVHTREKRCGGYFAFPTREEAEAFLAADRSALARSAVSVADYTVDNQATVGPWLPQVSEANIRDTIEHLSTAWPNRYYSSTHGQAAAEWIRDTWLALAGGRSDVSAELFTGCSDCSTQPSVILTVQGTELPGEVVVLGGHLDSISYAGSGDNMDAPGADDDASGIATLTEVIRVALASGWQPKRTVKFMGYAAEEVGLRGSNAIAQSFQDQGVNVVGVLQLDMTNYAIGASDDMQLVTDYSNAGLQQFVRDVFDAYLAPLGLTRSTYTCGYACSDHASWTSAGFPSAMMFEAGFNNDIHTPDDTLANMGGNASPSVPLAKLGLGFLGELAKTAGGGAENAPPVADFNAAVDGLSVAFTDASSDSDGSIVSRSWDFGDGGTSTDANPVHAYAAAGTYDVALTVTDDSGAIGSRTLAVTVEAGGGGGALEKGVPVTGQSGSAGQSLAYTLEVPAGASNLVFTMSGGSGDADLYVKSGSAPTDSTYDCRPYKSGNSEACTFASPAAGTWHVRIKGYSAFSGVSLVGDYGVDSGGGTTQVYANTDDVAIGDYATVYSAVTVSGRGGKAPASAQVDVDIRHTYTGDLRVDLVAPDGSVYLLHNRSGGSSDNIIRAYTVDLSAESLDGTWRLRVSDRGRGDTGRIDSWSVTF
ncbi:M20/M25/M40 family metallo-hydrolase [Luteimonas mephitis]|uniref:M20/M25/M40 family metallo-hydrolase n=1 Tax=Luteimonas mephitis TaxID=83615 RepID=UPI000412022E|nr:M20/M25/M40 family metallo-hydrolase [Luteimonas mephitis]